MTDYLKIYPKKLVSSATVPITGYRHASNLIFAASIVLPETHIIIKNLPQVEDTKVLINILEQLGGTCLLGDDNVTLNTAGINSNSTLNHTLCKKLHGSMYLLPALLARLGSVEFYESGGCQIGAGDGKRPMDHILKVAEAFGATVVREQHRVVVSATKLHACVIDINQFSFSEGMVTGPFTSGATKAAILLALNIRDQTTVILNPFLKSETIDLLQLVRELGFKVTYNSLKLEIQYNPIQQQVEHTVISDPSEIITYVSLAVVNHIQLQLTNISMHLTRTILQPEIDLLTKIGVQLTFSDDSIVVTPATCYSGTEVIITSAGVCTDHHPFLLAILLCAQSTSSITETVWHERFHYLPELQKFGIHLTLRNNQLEITPQLPKAASTPLVGLDLRAAALMLILALRSPGVTLIRDFEHLYRGYENLLVKLTSFGAQFEIIKAQQLTERVEYA